MDNIIIPASITLEKGQLHKKYKWKSENKISDYLVDCKRAVIRFTNRSFANKVNKLKREDRQIDIKFEDNENVTINRKSERNISIQGYSGLHPYVQIIINRKMPKALWGRLEGSNKKSITFHVNVKINLREWIDIELKPSDFLLEVEKEAKTLLDIALSKGFSVSKISKGRDFDISLTNLNKKNLILALSSHVASSKSRSKEKTIQKILMDISKMLIYLEENKDTIPVVITRPIVFENSWSFTTNRYLDFYKRKFGFIFLTTDFKKGWEENIVRELSKI